ncbi:hypothetical protein OAF45_03525, partial [Candidatus Latescibacteria bacterium]|nr:hypothetical protein [Candidatus Latescibacterota bacterium]
MDDIICSECNRTVPRGALYGHMLEMHDWSQEQLDELLSAFGEKKDALRVQRITGYRPFLTDKTNPVFRMKWGFLVLFVILLYFNTD